MLNVTVLCVEHNKKITFSFTISFSFYINSVVPLRTVSSQKARNLKNPLRRNKIKWPKANEADEWRKLDEHLSGLLQKALRGSVVAKLNLFGEILYEECRNRYGEVTIREAVIRSKGRREKEIYDLVASRRQLRKRWRKAEESEKEGLKALWDEIRRRLANLRRAERIRRRRKGFLQESISVCTWAPRGEDKWNPGCLQRRTT